MATAVRSREEVVKDVTEDEAGLRVIDLLALELKPGEILTCLATVNGRRADGEHRVQAGDRAIFWPVGAEDSDPRALVLAKVPEGGMSDDSEALDLEYMTRAARIARTADVQLVRDVFAALAIAAAAATLALLCKLAAG